MQFNAWHCLLFAVIINFCCTNAMKAQFDIAVRLIKAKTSFNGNHSTNLSKITNLRIPLFNQNCNALEAILKKSRIIDKNYEIMDGNQVRVHSGLIEKKGRRA